MSINFTHCKVNKLKLFGGANGNKISIQYQDEDYMLKFPPKAKPHSDMSYFNSCISEYVACHIFESLGIPTQKTLLGMYQDKITVACKDFTGDGFELREFAQLKNTIIDSEQNGYGTELTDILNTIHEQQIISSEQMEIFFWHMFIGDALLGNFDRHNGNWGLLINHNFGEVKMAPVFDCGSCLYPQIDENGMQSVLSSKKEIEERIYVFPTSAIKLNERKINYADFLLQTKEEYCLQALRDVSRKIDLWTINAIIDSTPYISDTYKLFLKTMVRKRKEKIIDRALEREYFRHDTVPDIHRQTRDFER